VQLSGRGWSDFQPPALQMLQSKSYWKISGMEAEEPASSGWVMMVIRMKLRTSSPGASPPEPGLQQVPHGWALLMSLSQQLLVASAAWV
jgi:hypothetical protein